MTFTCYACQLDYDEEEGEMVDIHGENEKVFTCFDCQWNNNN